MKQNRFRLLRVNTPDGYEYTFIDNVQVFGVPLIKCPYLIRDKKDAQKILDILNKEYIYI